MTLRGNPPPKGFHEVKRNAKGEMIGRLDPKETERKQAKLKSDMEKYAARSKAAEERMLNQANGIREPSVIAPPSDVLGFVELQLLSDPAVLDGKGSGGLRTMTDDQRRERNRARMNEQAADARKALDKAIGGDEDDEPDFGYALNYKGEELPEELDNLHDELADDDVFDVGLNPEMEGD